MGFSKGLDYGGNQEISGQLDHVGPEGLIADNGKAPANRLKKRPAPLDRLSIPAASTQICVCSADSGRPKTGADTNIEPLCAR